MIDRDILIAKTNHIQNCLKRIHDTLNGHLDQFEDLDIQDIVVLNLQRAVQLTIDIASYIVSVERLGTPQSFKELFQILERNHFIHSDISQKMQKMVGFRNIAVHDYQAIDPHILKSIVSHHLGDFEAFYTAILTKN